MRQSPSPAESIVRLSKISSILTFITSSYCLLQITYAASLSAWGPRSVIGSGSHPSTCSRPQYRDCSELPNKLHILFCLAQVTLLVFLLLLLQKNYVPNEFTLPRT